MNRVGAVEPFAMFKKSIFFLYEHMGNVFLMSALWLACAFTVVLLPPATATVYYTVHRLIIKEDVSFKDSFRAFKRYFWVSEGLALVVLGIVGLLFFDTLFFATVPKSAIVKMLSGLLVWPLIFVAFASNYVTPLMVVYELSIAQVLKRSSILALDNLGFTIVFGFLALVIVFLGAVVPPFLILAFIATLAFYHITGVNAILESYDGVQTPGK